MQLLSLSHRSTVNRHHSTNHHNLSRTLERAGQPPASEPLPETAVREPSTIGHYATWLGLALLQNTAETPGHPLGIGTRSVSPALKRGAGAESLPPCVSRGTT